MCTRGVEASVLTTHVSDGQLFHIADFPEGSELKHAPACWLPVSSGGIDPNWGPYTSPTKMVDAFPFIPSSPINPKGPST